MKQIPGTLIVDLCNLAGVDPVDTIEIILKPHQAWFVVMLRDTKGLLCIDPLTATIAQKTICIPVQYPAFTFASN